MLRISWSYNAGKSSSVSVVDIEADVRDAEWISLSKTDTRLVLMEQTRSYGEG